MVENEWHLQIVSKVRACLERKERIADPKKAKKLYRKYYPKEISFYGLDTFYGMRPAFVAMDPESRKPIICLNPYFVEYSPQSQMSILIEEAIHTKRLLQLHENPNYNQYIQGELEAENKLLRIKDYLRLSKGEIYLLENRRACHQIELKQI